MWRRFDVGSVVDSLPFDDARVAAGAGGLTRQVTRAWLAATSEDLRRAGRGELVVTTAATLLGTGEPSDQLVARLDAAQIAGIAVRLDGSTELPSILIGAADGLDLPVITFPEGAALADVTTAVLDAVLEAQRQRLERMLDIHQRFTRIVLAGGGPPISRRRCTTCWVARSPSSIPKDARSWSSRPTPRSRYALVTGSGVRYPIRAGDQNYGEIVALTERSRARRGQVSSPWSGQRWPSRCARRKRTRSPKPRSASPRSRSKSSSPATRPTSSMSRKERSALVGISRVPARYCWHPSTRRRRAPFAWRARHDRRGRPATLGRDAIVWTRTATIAALLAPETDESSERRRSRRVLRSELDDRLRAVTVSIGVGRRVDDLVAVTQLRRGEPGRRCRSLGKGPPRHGAVRRTRARTAPRGDPDRRAGRVRPPRHRPTRRARSGKRNRTRDTLAVWLETRNMAEAGRRIHVHYNTLKNRLQRIEAIIGPVLTDAARR